MIKRVGWILGAIVLLILVGGCGFISYLRATPSPSPVGLSIEDTPPAPPTVTTRTAVPIDTPSLKPTATWVPTLPPATLSTDLMATIEEIEAETEDLRGLDRTLPITRTLMTREELAVYLEREFTEDYPPEEVEADVRVLAAFDFVPWDFDLKSLLLALYSSQILGMYDDQEDTFYIITEFADNTREDLDLLDQLTLAHEYTHGLQDQHFGLETFTDEDLLNDDQVLARLALMEGDATLAMTQYLYAHVSELTDQDLARLQGEESGADQEVLEKAPPIIRETLDFPYIYGLEFVLILQEEGWDAVNAAFADPPQSTEQILHPEKYLSRDEPTIVSLPPLTDTLGSGWHLVEAETLGEFQTGLYLAPQVDQATADLASVGWDGDQYAVYIQDSAYLLVFATVWDSPLDRNEFVAAYTEYAEGKYGQKASRTEGSELCWETPAQTTCLAWEGNRVLLILGPDPATVANVLDVVKQHTSLIAGEE